MVTRPFTRRLRDVANSLLKHSVGLPELEYLALYGRASTTMDVRSRSAYWQLSVSSQHMVKSLTLNPYMSLFL